MATALDKMIHTQPATLDSLADLDLSAQARLLSAAGRVWLIGTGTSRHAAELAAGALQTLGVDARWEASSRLVARPGQLRAGDAAVLITHTAATAYAVRARRLLLDAGVPLISITGPTCAWPEAISTPQADESETYTVSYTAALTVLARLTHHLGAPAADAQAVRATAELVRGVLAETGVDAVPLPARAMAIVGAGDEAITAREGALKIREGARILCEGFDSERLLHGAAAPYTGADVLVVLQPDADPDGLTAAVARAARGERLQVVELSAPRAQTSPLLAQIALTVRLQLLASRFAGQRGQDPDVAITGAWADPDLWRLGAVPPAADPR